MVLIYVYQQDEENKNWLEDKAGGEWMDIQDKAKPIIEIYQDGFCYRVVIDGKEIENLKSFSIQIDNDMNGITVKEPAHYQIEQYVPYRKAVLTDHIKKGG